jgi:hypothetical protein
MMPPRTAVAFAVPGCIYGVEIFVIVDVYVNRVDPNDRACFLSTSEEVLHPVQRIRSWRDIGYLPYCSCNSLIFQRYWNLWGYSS